MLHKSKVYASSLCEIIDVQMEWRFIYTKLTIPIHLRGLKLESR